MAVTRGCFGKIGVGATPDIVAEVRTWTLNQTAEVLDSSSIGTCTKTKTVGAVDSNGQISCWWDPTDTTGQEVLDVGTTVTLFLYPGGNSSGDVYYTGSAIITTIERSGGVDGVVEANFSYEINGAVSQAVVT